MRYVLTVTTIALLLAVVCVCSASVPGSISYQGKLTNTLGQPVSDGAYQVQFKLYTVITAGAPFWTSAKQEVTTSGGVFTTQLSPLAASDLAGKTDVWMEIWVGSPLAALSPRTKFTSAPYALISGGSWSLLGNAGTTPGTNFIGTTDNKALEFKVNNTRGFRLEPTSGTPNVIGGYSGNTVTALITGATISGGGSSDYPNSVNSVTGNYGTVGGGYGTAAGGQAATVGGGESNIASSDFATVGGGSGNTANGWMATIGGGGYNTASNDFATVGGGGYNTASGYSATVSGGDTNIASGSYATVGGGYVNTASGYSATLPGGFYNTALGAYSFAAGNRAKANHNGAFVWADNSNLDFASTAANQFLIRAYGNVGINTNSPSFTLHVNGSVAGNGQYTALSDLRYKTNISVIGNALDKVMKLRGVNFDWKKSDYPELAFGDGRQIGFVAQEIAQVMPEVVSKDDKGIYSVAYGSVVPMLVEALKEQQKTIDELRAKTAEIDELKARLAALEAKSEKN